MSKLIISVDPYVVKAAKIRGRALEFFVMKRRASSNYSIVGNVYKGIIRDVVPRLGAAFVDIGLEKNAFLCIDNHCLEQIKSLGIEIKEGNEIMVQVIKPMVSSKGPKVTVNITLAGNYLVLLKGVDLIGVSKHINDKAKQKKLRKILKECKDANVGFIARTASSDANRDEILKEANYLKSVCKSLDEKFNSVRAPALIYEEPQIPIRIIREYCDKETEEVIIDDLDVFEKTRLYLDKTENTCKSRLKFYDYNKPIFEYFGLEDEIKRLSENVVRLKSGGYITIEKTEAFFAIDVNAGNCRFYTEDNEETIFRINAEAAKEIFRQINLRDLGGLIIVDFIDMTNEAHIEELQGLLNNLAKVDRRKTYVGKISELGVVEISRRKNNTDIFDEMFDKCPLCYNGGLVKSIPVVCSEIYQKIKYSSGELFRLKATAGVIEYFRKFLSGIDKQIEYISANTCNPEDYFLEVVR